MSTRIQSVPDYDRESRRREHGKAGRSMQREDAEATEEALTTEAVCFTKRKASQEA